MYLIAVQFLQRKACESTQRQRKQKLLSRNTQQDRKPHCIYLQRSHIIECVVQFLADGLVFQLLSIQLICRAKGGERGRMKCRSNRRIGKFRGVATEQGEVEEKEKGKEMNVKYKNWNTTDTLHRNARWSWKWRFQQKEVGMLERLNIQYSEHFNLSCLHWPIIITLDLYGPQRRLFQA